LVKFAGRNAMVATYVGFIAGSSHCSIHDREGRSTSISAL